MKSKYYLGMALWLVVTIGLLLVAPSPKLARSQDSQVIESNDPHVVRSGDWTLQAASDASGGSYLYSGGADSDILTLEFAGPSIEILYVAGPSLGVLAINVDDTVLRTVITTDAKTAYQQSSRIDYLSNETHTLKVYAQEGGLVAVDAFIIHAAASDTGSLASEGRITPCGPIHQIHRVSLTSTGGQSNGESYMGGLSNDDSLVTFFTYGALVPADTNAVFDVYTYNRLNCTLELISVSTTGGAGNNHSTESVLSGNGRYVVFYSNASNLVANDTNSVADIFVRDRVNQTTTRASLSNSQLEGNSYAEHSPTISNDGRYVVFTSNASNLVANDTNNVHDVFVRDMQLNETTRVSVATGGAQADAASEGRSISDSARYVLFQSNATNLVAGDSNGLYDVFVHDRNTNTTTRVSVASGGVQALGGDSWAAQISGNGNFVVFISDATNLVPNDTNAIRDVFVYDRTANITTRVSVATGGAQAIGGGADMPSITYDGRYVGFHSSAANLVPNDTNAIDDGFVHDRVAGVTRRVSVSASGAQSSGWASRIVLSNYGNYVGFSSTGADLVTGDTNGFTDVFVAPNSPVTSADNLALFNPPFQMVALLNTLTDNPPANAYTAFSAYAPTSGGQWVMGDWNGDGLDTPGVTRNGAFYFTNVPGESTSADWKSFWIGLIGPVVSGRFSSGLPNDCIGIVDSGNFPPYGTAFVLYYTCDMSATTTIPAISYQWLSVVLPDSQGFTGTHQFTAGDFDGDGVDSVAVRRGPFIAFGNVAPTTGPAAFNLAQYIGTPGTGDEGLVVAGDWDGSGADSFGLFYQNGELFYRNDLDFNPGVHLNQSVGTPFGSTGVQVASWR